MTMNKYITALILACSLLSAPAFAADRCEGTMGDFAEFVQYVEKVNNTANVEINVLTEAQVTLLESVLGPIPEQYANTQKVAVIHNDKAAIIALVDAQGCLLSHTKPVDYQQLGAVLGLIRAKD